MKLLLLAHLASTLVMVGVIWVVQLVHYPLFASVGATEWAGYATQHSTRITLVVGPAMLVELATAVLLAFYRPAALPPWSVMLGAALVGILWASTAFLQAPLHNALTSSFDADTHARLVATNWVRTAAWTLRGALALWMTGRLLAV